jgi:hypothetical protein
MPEYLNTVAQRCYDHSACAATVAPQAIRKLRGPAALLHLIGTCSRFELILMSETGFAQKPGVTTG